LDHIITSINFFTVSVPRRCKSGLFDERDHIDAAMIHSYS